MLYLCFLVGALSKVPFFLLKALFRPFLIILLHPDAFHFSALPTLLRWSVFTKLIVEPLPAVPRSFYPPSSLLDLFACSLSYPD